MAFIILAIGLLAVCTEFFLPGGILGSIAAFFIISSIFIFAANSDSLILTTLYIIGVVALLILFVKYMLWRLKQGKLGRTIYSADDQEGFVASTWDTSLVGKEGIVFSDLKPGGYVKIEGKQYQAISQSGYIVKGNAIVVIDGEGDSLIVKQI
jgi:membrane-bound serine protease (ClpP class)